MHVRALPELRTRVPVTLPASRHVGVMADGATPFTAEPRLPGTALRPGTSLGSIARSQLQGVLAALAAVPPKSAGRWGVAGEGEVLLQGALAPPALLVDGPRLTGITSWRLHLGTGEQALDPALSALLG